MATPEIYKDPLKSIPPYSESEPPKAPLTPPPPYRGKAPPKDAAWMETKEPPRFWAARHVLTSRPNMTLHPAQLEAILPYRGDNFPLQCRYNELNKVCLSCWFFLPRVVWLLLLDNSFAVGCFSGRLSIQIIASTQILSSAHQFWYWQVCATEIFRLLQTTALRCFVLDCLMCCVVYLQFALFLIGLKCNAVRYRFWLGDLCTLPTKSSSWIIFTVTFWSC